MAMARFKLKQQEIPEADVLKSVLEFLEWETALGRVIWFARMNVGAGRLMAWDKKKKDWRAPSQYIKFGFVGCPDIVGGLPGGIGLYLEAKRRGGRVREEQGKFIEKCAASGAAAAVVESVEDAQRVLLAASEARGGEGEK